MTVRVTLNASLTAVVFASDSSTLGRLHLNGIRIKLVGDLTPNIVVNNFVKDCLARLVPARCLPGMFNVVMLLLTLRVLLTLGFATAEAVPSPLGATTSNNIVNIMSDLTNVNNNSLAMPCLDFRNVRVEGTVNDSSLYNALVTVTNVVKFIVRNMGMTGLPTVDLNCICLPTLYNVDVASVFAAEVNTGLTSRLPARALGGVFTMFLMFVNDGVFLKWRDDRRSKMFGLPACQSV